MSHQPERKQKDCLNCGEEVVGRFCHVCGQENIVTHQSFLSLTKHFIYDILHFDGKFFHTIGYLFFWPGFVAKQYSEGKRMRYLDPIRMYLFTSAFFFLILFSINTLKVGNENASGRLSNEGRLELAAEYQKRLDKKPSDSVLKNRIAILRDTTREVSLDSVGIRRTTFSFDNRSYVSLKEYDSIQSVLTPVEKDGWIERRLMRQIISINEKYGYSEKTANFFLQLFMHKLPYLLFVSLPFFALILKWMYRRQKNLYYSDHAVFTLYHYIFSFTLLLLAFGLNGLKNWTGWGVFGFLYSLLFFAWPVYLYIEMKNFYRQGRSKTLGKFLLLNVSGLVILLLLFLIFLLFSIFQM